jgi:hypothetical protein
MARRGGKLTDLESWLSPRLEQVPESLRARILEVVVGGGKRETDAASGATIPDALRSLADLLLEQARTGPATHDTAITLLAADALITYACEAAAELGPEMLAGL